MIIKLISWIINILLNMVVVENTGLDLSFILKNWLNYQRPTNETIYGVV